MKNKKIKNKTVSVPNNVHRFTVREKIMISLGTMILIGIFLIASSITVSNVAPLSAIMGIVGLLICIIAIISIIMACYVFRNKKSNLDSILRSENFKNFCYQKKLYTQSLYDNRQVNIPKAEITNEGFRLLALPGIAGKTLDSKEDLNNFLVQNGLDIYIVNAYAGGDGWLYFDISKNFRNDKL